MKKFTLIISLLVSGYVVKAQYCGNYAKPDYREIINHSHEPSYRPCENQSRQAWFYMQQQRLEQRMKELKKDHEDEIRALASEYIPYMKEYYFWTYETRPQFEKGINFLYKVDKALDGIELGKSPKSFK